MTVVMGVGIAIVQPSLPSLVALWTPRRVALATASFSNGFLIGEILPAALTVPWVLALVGGGWEWALAFWSVPVALTAIAVVLGTVHEAPEAGTRRALWIPDWGNPTTWRLGLTLGTASAAYFGLNAFIPDYMRSIHQPGLITPSLTCLNLFQLPASFVVGRFSRQILGRRWPFVATGLVTLTAMAAFIATLAVGAAWDLSGSSASAYLMVIAAAVVQTVAPLGLRLQMRTGSQT